MLTRKYLENNSIDFMFNQNNETALISQLLNSVDNHLKIIHSPMNEHVESPDDNELWLSDHRSIFSSDDNHEQKHPPTLRDSQYEGFHWDLYDDHNYHQFTFEHDQENCSQSSSLSEWSMNLNSDEINPPQTSWHEIKTKSIQNSYSSSSSTSSTNTSDSDNHYNPNPLTLYRLFQYTKSRQHPCYLYDNFSDQSLCDSFQPKQHIKTNVDQCLQTSASLSDNNNPTKTTILSQSLPDLDFLTYYAKENPSRLSTQPKACPPIIKNPLSLPKKPLHTIFYCSIKTPKTPEIETFSSGCSSTTSSGYFSNSSTNQTRPLKSCLKHPKTSSRFISNHRRYSTPNDPTFSTHKLRTKKSVSFCNSPKYRYDDYCDLVPRESLTDSPPNEFNLSDDNDEQITNFIDDIPEDLAKPLPVKYGNDKYLIDAFANIILRILEIKCSDPKSYYLNNQLNSELDRILRQDFCPLLRELLEDGLRQHSGSLFSKKVNLWRLIDLATPTNEAKMKAQINLPSNIDWIEKFNSFIYHLLNLHELVSWLTNFMSQQKLLSTYYESWAFVLVNNNNDLFENITNQLEKLSPLSFRLKYTSQRSSTTNLSKKFNVKTWLREKKVQVKTPPSSSPAPPNVVLRRKFNSIPISK